VVAPGINGKMSEINAAFGLVQLKFVDQMIERRRAIEARYKRLLGGVAGIGFIETLTHESANASYCPILIGKNFPVSRDRLYDILREKNVIARRYFYPLISTFPMYRGHQSSDPSKLPIATETAEQVLCIPIHPNLSDADVDYVAQAIMSVTT
jgi:dTDP-4-amino-4,6-dideoxygalactose transaminase